MPARIQKWMQFCAILLCLSACAGSQEPVAESTPSAGESNIIFIPIQVPAKQPEPAKQVTAANSASAVPQAAQSVPPAESKTGPQPAQTKPAAQQNLSGTSAQIPDWNPRGQNQIAVQTPVLAPKAVPKSMNPVPVTPAPRATVTASAAQNQNAKSAPPLTQNMAVQGKLGNPVSSLPGKSVQSNPEPKQIQAGQMQPAQAQPAPLTKKVTPASQPQRVPPVSEPQKVNPATTPDSAAVAVAEPKPVSGEQAAYRAALAAYNGKRYDESERRFEAFAREYPKSKLVPNAIYWKGESLYSRGRYADAILQFKDVISRYPKHHKTPDALLKSGMAYQRINDSDNARLHYQVLQEDFPQSPAARRGKALGLFR